MDIIITPKKSLLLLRDQEWIDNVTISRVDMITTCNHLLMMNNELNKPTNLGKLHRTTHKTIRVKMQCLKYRIGSIVSLLLHSIKRAFKF